MASARVSVALVAIKAVLTNCRPVMKSSHWSLLRQGIPESGLPLPEARIFTPLPPLNMDGGAISQAISTIAA
jgi:hypothetical protein